MDEKTKRSVFYDSLKKIGTKKEEELDRIIHDINNKDFIKMASRRANNFGQKVNRMNESMETISSILNFSTKRDMANVAKMQVQLEEKIDRVEQLLRHLKTNGNTAQISGSSQNKHEAKKERKEKNKPIF
ncbi:hypothetical protein [Peribacillus sp. SCS-155]|uniref:hypothetical protein n=1 Tax=Peribacillus sedimenti TaxID=3115297 RepID=UPI003905FD13